MTDEMSISAFTEALGSGAPTPGGGAASALVGALGAALAEMVARFTVGRKSYAAVEPQAQDIVQRAAQARVELLALVAADEQAFQQVSAAYKMNKGTDDEREQREVAIQTSLAAAMEPPTHALRLSMSVVSLAYDIAAIGNATVLTDAACAAIVGESAARAAAINILANVALLKDTAAGEQALQAARSTLSDAARLRDETLAIVYRRMNVAGL